jgi:hypothetical protein
MLMSKIILHISSNLYFQITDPIKTKVKTLNIFILIPPNAYKDVMKRK